MEQPKKPKFDPNKAYEEVKTSKPAFNPDLPFDEVKKKAPSTSIVQEKELVLEPTSGSSAGQNTKYGLRSDGTPKGSGYFGPLKMKDGSNDVATEISIGINIDGKETEIPTLVPSLTEQEKDWLLKGNDPNDRSKIGESITKKAIDFSKFRRKQGLPYFSDTNPLKNSTGISNTELKKFTGLSSSDLKSLESANKNLPKVDTKIKNTLDDYRKKENRKNDLEDELSDVKVTPENMDKISAKTTELNNINKEFQKAKEISQDREIKKQKYSKISSLTNKFLTGSSQLGADISAIPEFTYDIFSIPQNAIADIFDAPSLRTDSEKFKKTIGVNNQVKDYYKNEVSKLREEAQKTDLKYTNGVYDSFVQGDYAAGFDQLTNSFAESLPATSSIMVGGAYTKAPQLMAASSMMFGAGKNEKLKDENPEMNTNLRVTNALATGFIQGATETLGSGSIGAAAKGLVEREGTKKATTILKDGLVNYYKSALEKNPMIASMSGEGLEEAFQGVAENAVDVATGVKPADYNIYQNAVDDFIGGSFGGAVFGAGLKGIQQVANYQDKNQIKANTKKIFNLQNELQNPDLSPESKAEIDKSIDYLINVNRKLVQKNVDHVESLTSRLREELTNAISVTESTKEKANKIKNDNNTSYETKKILLDNLQKEYIKANELKNNILEGSVSEVDVLPLKDQDKLKREALKELTEELNPEGKKNIKITNEQITERANKNYLKKLVESKKIESDLTQGVQETSSEHTDFDLYHTSNNSNLTINDISVEPRQTRQGKKWQYGGLYTYDNIEDINSFSKGNQTTENYGINLNDGVEISDYNGPIERLDKNKIQELRDQGIQVIRGKSIFGKTEIIVIDKSAIKEIKKINNKVETKNDANINDGTKTKTEVQNIISNEIGEIPVQNTQEIEPQKEDSNNESVPDLDIKASSNAGYSGKKGFTGSFFENYDYLDQGIEHTVYRSKDGEKVIKLADPNETEKTYDQLVNEALEISNLIGDGSLKVIGKYKGANGKIYPVYEQNFIEGEKATNEQIREYLKKLGFITKKGKYPSMDNFLIKKNGEIKRINDITENFIINKEGNILGIDASIRTLSPDLISKKLRDKLNEANSKNNYSGNKLESDIQQPESKKNDSKNYSSLVDNLNKDLEAKINDIEKRRQQDLEENNVNGLIPVMLNLDLPENKRFYEKKKKQDEINTKYDSEIEELRKTSERNETISGSNITNDEGIESGVKPVDEVRVAKQENIVQKPVPETPESRTSETKVETTEDKPKTALKNADIAKKRKELGLEEREKVTRKKGDELIDTATKKIKEGYDVENLIEDILDNKSDKTLTDEEVVILKQYQLAKENRLVEIGEEIVSATNEGSSSAKLDKLIQERESLVDDIDKAYRAGEQSGTVTARALQARRLAMLQDYSLANMLIQKRKAIGDQKLTPEQIKETTDDYAKIQKLKSQLEEKILSLEKENADLKAGKNIEGLTREERKSKRKVKVEEIDSDIDATIENLRKKLREQAGRLSANAIPIEMIPDIAKLAQLYVKKGIIKLDDIVDGIYTSLKEDIDNLSKDDIKEIIADYDYKLEEKNQKRLDSLKKRTIDKTKELKDKLSKQDFEKKQNTPVQLDKEAKQLKEELRKAKFEWDKALEKDILDRRTKLQKYRDYAAEVLSLPRSVMASIDFSAPLRQGLVLTVNNPATASKAFVEMFRQAFSQNRFDTWLEDLKETPQYQVMKDSGLYIADTNSAKLSAKEEQFMSNLANKIPIIGKGFEATIKGKKIKVGGLDLIGGSERAYVSYLNKLRTDVFAKTADTFEKEGLNLENSPKLYKALGNYINSATGRGNLGKFNDSSTILNSLFFSPRLIASRVNLLTNWANPVWYENTPAKIRQMYALDMARFVGVGLTLLSLASLGGADAEEDPRSSDFGKIRSGDTRWDIWGGFQQFARFFAQMLTGQRKNTNTKQIKDLDGTGFNSETRADVFLNMLRSKLAPVPGTLWNLSSGKTMVGEKYALKDVPKSFLPLFASDLYKAMERDGAYKGVLETGIPAVFGVGVQTYPQKESSSNEKGFGSKLPSPPKLPTPK